MTAILEGKATPQDSFARQDLPADDKASAGDETRADEESPALDESPVELGQFDLSDISCDDSIALYLKEMGSVPLLSLEQEVRLAQAVCQGREAERALQEAGLDPLDRGPLERKIEHARQARGHLIQANTRLVIHGGVIIRGE